MSDHIKREDIVNLAVMMQTHLWTREQTYNAIFCLPSADVVEVVRCKDCVWWTKQEASCQGRCALLGIYPTGAWYCANGAKMDEGGSNGTDD